MTQTRKNSKTKNLKTKNTDTNKKNTKRTLKKNVMKGGSVKNASNILRGFISMIVSPFQSTDSCHFLNGT